MPGSKLLSVGDVAPAFKLSDHGGKTVSLSDFAGKKNVVLVFYPGDMTPGCTMQLCALRDDWPKFTALDTVIFGVNHADAESHAAFRKKYSIPFPLLVDDKKTVTAKYGAIRHLAGLRLIRRTIVVIGRNGKILLARRGMPKNADILKVLN